MNLDIKKLQRAIVDGLEDMKGHNIVVFNTEHLSPLFERVVIASGTSNRQTKALAQGVRDAVKKRGMQVLRTEGEDNGEWIIVDCGAAVVHLMQPSIRDYYHLEEIWGDKPVKMKLDTAPVRLVKASEPEPEPAKKPAAKKAAARRAPAKTTAAKKSPASQPAPRAAAPAAKRAAPAKGPGAQGAAPRRAGVTSTSGVTRTVGVKTAASKAPAKTAARAPAKAPAKAGARPAAKASVAARPAAKAPATRKPAAKAAPARKAAAAKTPARKTSGRS